MRQIKIVLLLSVVLTGCATTESVTRGMHDAATLVVEAPITSVYRLVVETAIESGFLIVSEDPARKEIRLRSGSYMTGMFLCSGHILGVFLSEDRLGRTRVEVSERRVLATQVLGCHDKAPGYMTLLNSKISSVSQRAPTPRTPEIVGGTAFAVRPDGVLLTAFHVVRGAKMIVATCPDGSASPATIEQAAANIDLAVLRIARSTPAFIPLGGTRSSRVGDPVFTVGFPTPALLGREPKFSDGAVSALTGPGGEATFIQMTVPVQPGNSGGPLLNNDGAAIGVVTSSAAVQVFLAATGTLPQNINWAVKSEYATPLFERPDSLAKASNREAAIERAMKAVCLIEVTRQMETR